MFRSRFTQISMEGTLWATGGCGPSPPSAQRPREQKPVSLGCRPSPSAFSLMSSWTNSRWLAAWMSGGSSGALLLLHMSASVSIYWYSHDGRTPGSQTPSVPVTPWQVLSSPSPKLWTTSLPTFQLDNKKELHSQLIVSKFQSQLPSLQYSFGTVGSNHTQFFSLSRLQMHWDAAFSLLKTLL